jgi:hypothetical protein
MWRAGRGLLWTIGLCGAMAAALAEDAPTADAVKKKIAELDLAGAARDVAQLKAEAKTPEQRKVAKDFDREIATGKKIEPVLNKMLKLLDDGKPREAYGVATGAIDDFPGAVALGALRPHARAARRAGFFVVDDFDEPETPGRAPGAAGPKGAAPRWAAHASKVELVPDPLGGRALRWTADAPKGKAFIDHKLDAPINLDDYDGLSVRIRAVRAGSGKLDIGFDVAARGHHAATPAIKLEPGEKWTDVHVPFSALERKKGFDPAAVIFVVFYYAGDDAVDVEIDDFLLVPKK